MGCCTECYELELIKCDNEVFINGGFTEDGLTYYAWITDKFGNVQIQECTTVIDGDDYPLPIVLTYFLKDGEEFNEFAGSFFLSCSTSESENTEELMTFEGEQYTCVKIDFKNISTVTA